ncbi:MAG: HAMP domain-containing protein, partial [Clostridia bacterium]|nr:HAMP domain-containing protein [Clostridia bacterium]
MRHTSKTLNRSVLAVVLLPLRAVGVLAGAVGARFGIGVKIAGSMGLLCLLVVSTGLFAAKALENVTRGFDSLLQGEVQVYTAALEATAAVEAKVNAVRGYLLSGDPSRLPAIETAKDSTQSSLLRLRRVLGAQAEERMAAIEAANKRFDAASDEAVRLADLGQREEAIRLAMGEAQAARDELRNQLNSVIYQARLDVLRGEKLFTAQAGAAQRNVLVATGVAVLVALLLSVLLPRAIVRPVVAAARTARAVAGGDLSVARLNIRSRDEVGVMAQAIDRMVEDLRQVLGELRTTSLELAAASEEMNSLSAQSAQAAREIATAVEEVARGAGEQSATASQTAAVMTQLREAIEQVATGAQAQARDIQTASDRLAELGQAIQAVVGSAAEVAQASAETLEAARRGGESVQRTVDGMLRIRAVALDAAERVRELGERSRRIGEIGNVISEIADQTNLLALNAAIEAARAGDHGRGFAVVAEEVRRLAERSRSATQDIASLVASIYAGAEDAVEAMSAGTREVETGTELARQAGAALEA